MLADGPKTAGLKNAAAVVYSLFNPCFVPCFSPVRSLLRIGLLQAVQVTTLDRQTLKQ
jgi:hypothetical protein